MLEHAATMTVLPVRDAARAAAFYAGTLGLHALTGRAGGQVLFRLGSGGTLALLPKPDGRPSDSTELSFSVPDLEEAIAALKDRGVAFEDYDLPGFRTENHIAVLEAERAAWFKDSEGNILCLHQDLQP